MKKTLSLPIFILLLCFSNSYVYAAFTPLPDGDYQMLITSGCFTFGDCSASPASNFVDNNSTVATPQGQFGSGIAGDNAMGVIEFTYTNGAMAITSFSQDSYLGTAGGIFAIEAPNTSNMGGSIDNTGNMTFDPTGRSAVAQFFSTSIGIQPWNIPPNSTSYDQWTTGNSTNVTASLTGTPLQDAGSDAWNGTLVLASEVGPAWGLFSGTPYTEIYNITIISLGEQIPRAKVRVTVQGGTTQECNEHGGSTVTYNSTVDLFNGGELSSLDWLLDGEIVSSGTDFSYTTYTLLGQHTIEAIATLVTGHTGSDLVSVNIKDTLQPGITPSFIDARTHEVITEIADNEKHYVEVELLAEDICDPQPTTSGTIVPVFTVNNADIIIVKAKKGLISMPSTALNLNALAKDRSGNALSAYTSLKILTDVDHNHIIHSN